MLEKRTDRTNIIGVFFDACEETTGPVADITTGSPSSSVKVDDSDSESEFRSEAEVSAKRDEEPSVQRVSQLSRLTPALLIF